MTGREKISIDYLVSTRWMFGPQGTSPVSSAFFFTADGRFEGYRHPNEGSWRLEDGVLTIYSDSGELSWKFSPKETDDTGALLGKYQRDENVPSFLLTPFIPSVRLTKPSVSPESLRGPSKIDENVRLVIWDLDDTFWRGTLSEDEVTILPANVEIIKILTERGIVNSICSKNNYEQTRSKLIDLGIWDYFIFPRIAFASKGPLIHEIIAASNLRPDSVLFLDDNLANLDEASQYNPGLQVSLPILLPGILNDHRFRGKADPDHRRLKTYKILEDKHSDQEKYSSDHDDFLAQSDIKISFHYDILENFDRIHELVNRTNQLNFTKLRWPEDKAEARQAYRNEIAEGFNTQSGYIKVSDRYGDYGACGFYLVHSGCAKHFLFSCRSMNMGIEQFVWQKLRRPHLAISGEVASDIAAQAGPISLVEDVDSKPSGSTLVKEPGSGPITICIRGACDLEMIGHYLNGSGHIIREYPYPFQGWAIAQTARAAMVNLEVISDESQDLIAKLPGMPMNRFGSSITDSSADIYVLSFSQEYSTSLYRSRSTDIILPLRFDQFPGSDLTSIEYEKIIECGRDLAISRERWDLLRSDLTYIGEFDGKVFRSDLTKILIMLTLIKKKTVIVLMLNDKVGANKWLLQRFLEINEITRSTVNEWNRINDLKVETVELNDFVRSDEDLTEEGGGAHFTRETYRKVSDRVAAIVKSSIRSRVSHS